MTDLTYKATDVPTGKVSPAYIQQETQKLANAFRKTKKRLDDLEAAAVLSLTNSVATAAVSLIGTTDWKTGASVSCSAGAWVISSGINIYNNAATAVTGTISGRLLQGTDTVLCGGSANFDFIPYCQAQFSFSTAVNLTATTTTFSVQGSHSSALTQSHIYSSAQFSFPPTYISAIKLA